MPIESTTALRDVLHAHGLMYLQTGNCFDTDSWTRYGPRLLARGEADRASSRSCHAAPPTLVKNGSATSGETP